MEWKVSISEIEIKNLIEIKELTKTLIKEVNLNLLKYQKGEVVTSKLDLMCKLLILNIAKNTSEKIENFDNISKA